MAVLILSDSTATAPAQPAGSPAFSCLCWPRSTIETRTRPMTHAMIQVRGNAAAARSLHSPILMNRPITRPAAIPAAGLHVVTARLLREDGERYTADPDDDDAASASMSDAAELHTRHARDAQALLDDAVNLIGVLLDAVELDGDTRAEQARAVLGMAVECLHGAHRAIEQQERRDEGLYVAYAGLKAAMEDEERVPADDFSSDDGEVGGED